MKKILFSLSLGLLVAVGSASAQVFINEDFNSGTTLPAGWSSTVGTWKIGEPDDITKAALAGASFADPAHTHAIGYDGAPVANGTILTLPAITIPAGATATKIVFDKAYLKVSLKADPSKKETFTFVASTNGGTSWTPVKEITPKAGWETTSIDLGSYANSTVTFGFKYENVNTQLVGVALDNIRIYVQEASDIALTSADPVQTDLDNYYTTGSTATIGGSIFNYGSDSITSYVVKYQQGSNAPVSYTVNANIAPLSKASFTSNTPFTIPSVGDFPIKVWVELPGDAYHGDDSADAYVHGVSFLPNKHIVFEENTCTKCTWCPRGSVMMDQFIANHPGEAALISVHDNYQGPDPMATLSSYISHITTQIPGYTGNPSVLLDRRIYNDPYYMESMYNDNKNNFGFADVTMGTPAVSGSTASVTVTVHPAVDLSNAKLALVVTESNVTGTTSGYNQVNAYAGGNYGAMGGFEKYSNPVPAANIRYHFVARAISPSPTGAPGSLPATMTAGSTNQATLTATLDPSWNQANLQYLVLLIGDDGTILNSAFSDVPELQSVLHKGTAIKDVSAGINDLKIYPNPAKDIAYLSLNIKEATKANISVTDITGREVAQPMNVSLSSGANTVNIPTTNLSGGTYFVNFTTPKTTLVLQLQVVK